MSAEAARAAGPRRTLLGGQRGLLSNVRVYRTADAVEVDEVEGYDVSRRSVLLDEVLLVTYHQAFGWKLLVGLGRVRDADRCRLRHPGPRRALITGVVPSPSCGLPFVIAAALRLALRLDVVTVYGIRSKASMSFWFRKRRAREVFALVCRLARERQPPRPAAARRVPAAPLAAPPPLGAPEEPGLPAATG